MVQVATVTPGPVPFPMSMSTGRAGGASSGAGGGAGSSRAAVQLEFADHTLHLNQDVAVWYKQRAGGEGSKRCQEESVAFFGRVTCIRMKQGRSNVICAGPVSLQDRLEGVTIQCAWFQELEGPDGALPPPSFALGPPTLETGAWRPATLSCVCHCVVVVGTLGAGSRD